MNYQAWILFLIIVDQESTTVKDSKVNLEKSLSKNLLKMLSVTMIATSGEFPILFSQD